MDSVNSIMDNLHQAFQQPTNVYIALAVVILTTVLISLVFVFGKKSGDTVLLLGLCNSGKTLMYSWLTAGKSIATQTSLLENKGSFVCGKGKSWNIIDLPGHERVRAKFFHAHKENTRGVVFVVDSVNFPREMRDIAEYLYDVFVNRTMQKRKISVLIVCNKQDVSTAKSCSVVKMQLEKELDTLRQTRSAALLGTDDSSSSKNAFIGREGSKFDFSHLYPIQVEFCEASLKPDDDGNPPEYKPITEWLNKL